MAAAQGCVGDHRRPDAVTPAELRALLADCLALWGVEGRVDALDVAVAVV